MVDLAGGLIQITVVVAQQQQQQVMLGAPAIPVNRLRASMVVLIISKNWGFLKVLTKNYTFVDKKDSSAICRLNVINFTWEYIL